MKNSRPELTIKEVKNILKNSFCLEISTDDFFKQGEFLSKEEIQNINGKRKSKKYRKVEKAGKIYYLPKRKGEK